MIASTESPVPSGSSSSVANTSTLRRRPPHPVGPAEIRACLEQLHDLLKRDAARANSVFRQILEPITMTPVEERGRRIYRATGAAKWAEMLNRLGVDPGG